MTASEDTPNALAAEEESYPGSNGHGKHVANDQDEENGAANFGFTVNDRRFWKLDEEALAEESSRSQLPSYVETLKASLEEKDKQLREYIAAYKKEVGEGLEKTKERLTRENAQQLEQLRGQICLPLLDVLASLERSLSAAQSSTNFEALLEGLKMVHLLMMQKLQEIGLSRIPTVGQPFDPAKHEAVSLAPVEEPAQDNHVLIEVSPGFLLGEKVIRPAQVVVGKLS